MLQRVLSKGSIVRAARCPLKVLTTQSFSPRTNKNLRRSYLYYPPYLSYQGEFLILKLLFGQNSNLFFFQIMIPLEWFRVPNTRTNLLQPTILGQLGIKGNEKVFC